MRIKEVEELTGITSKNIRFYEKEGLISPQRSENGYRDYSDEDIEILKSIKLYRKLDISLEDIKLMQKNILSVDKCMDKYYKFMKEKIKELNDARKICEQIRVEYESGYDINIEKYLDNINSSEKKGGKFVNIAYDFITKAKGCIPSATIYFEPINPITNEREFTEELFKYADKEKLNLVILKESMRPIVAINGVKHIGVLEIPRMINIPILPIFCAQSYGFKWVYLYKYE